MQGLWTEAEDPPPATASWEGTPLAGLELA